MGVGTGEFPWLSSRSGSSMPPSPSLGKLFTDFQAPTNTDKLLDDIRGFYDAGLDKVVFWKQL